MKNPREIPTRHRKGRLLRWLGLPAVAVAALATGAAPALAGRDIVPQETRDIVDVLQLRCHGEDGDVASVVCRWTVPDGAVGVKVARVALGSGGPRQVVHRTGDPMMNTFVDSPVRRGVRYLYVVRALDSNGSVVAASRPAVAGVALPSTPRVEALRLDCTATGEVAVRCRWTAPTSRARVLTLWRSVDGNARERVTSFANPFPTSYGDIVPNDTSRAVYAVIATDGAGEIVGRSRADGVAFDTATNPDRPEIEAAPAADPVVPEPATPTPQPRPTLPDIEAPDTVVPETVEPNTVELDVVDPSAANPSVAEPAPVATSPDRSTDVTTTPDPVEPTRDASTSDADGSDRDAGSERDGGRDDEATERPNDAGRRVPVPERERAG